MRLIDADEAIINFGFEWDDISPTRDEFVEFIKKQPTIEAEPVKHGRWISKNPHGYEWTFVCSNCGYVDGHPFNDRHNYCPNCGSKMESEE